MKTRKFGTLLALFVVLLTVGVSQFVFPQEARKSKKLIEWGWDEPDTQFIRQHIQNMEQMPFDGLIFHVLSSQKTNLSWELWGDRRFDSADFRQAIEDLQATPFIRLTDRFLRVNVTPGNVDWFDDRAWAVVVHNFKVAAEIAKQGGCKGFMFDVEQYKDQLFHYEKQKHHQTKSFAEYQAQVRQRGREWMHAISEQYPDITILLTFGYSITGEPKGRATANYGLLADFLDGIWDVCPPQATIVDAWEGAYPYKQRDQFRKAYETIKVQSAQWTAVPEKYRRQIQAGFGIWMDCNWPKEGWHVDDFSKNHFTPAQFQETVRLALGVSDRYVWIYTEQPRWWTNEKLPKEYVEALRNAKLPEK